MWCEGSRSGGDQLNRNCEGFMSKATRALVIAGFMMLLTTTAAFAACPANLTAVTLNEQLANGQLAFKLDDENLAPPPPLYLAFDGASLNANNEMFTGTVSANLANTAGSYPVSGTLNQVNSGTLAFKFSYHVPSGPGFPGFGATYSYAGSIRLTNNSQSCLFFAGTYTTVTLVQGGRFGVTATSAGPFPFSGTLAAAITQ